MKDPAKNKPGQGMVNPLDNKKLQVSGWITLALAAASLEPILIKFGYRGLLTATQLVVLKNITAALVIMPLWSRITPPPATGLKKLVVPGMLLFTTNVMVFVALQQLQVVLLITIVTTTPALVALLNSWLGREVAGKKFWIGLIMCFAGVILTLDYSDISVNYFGVICACISAGSSTLYRVQMEALTEEYSPVACSFATFLLQAILTLAALPFVTAIPPQAYPLGLWLGLSALLANIGFLAALNMVGSTRISILTMLQRPLIVLLAAFSLHEQVTALQVAGIVLVMIGVHFAKVERLQPAEALEPIIVEPTSRREQA